MGIVAWSLLGDSLALYWGCRFRSTARVVAGCARVVRHAEQLVAGVVYDCVAAASVLARVSGNPYNVELQQETGNRWAFWFALRIPLTAGVPHCR